MNPDTTLREQSLIGPGVGRLLLLLCTVVILLANCSARVPSPAAQIPVTVQLFWTHNAEFAGFYAAEQQGYYANEGLAVTLREGGTTVDYLTPVSDGSAQFGHAGADELLVARAAGQPLRVVATVYRRSPSAFVALANSGITRPQDFVGKTIRVTPQSLTHFRAMMARVGIHPEQYTVVNLPSEVDLFAAGRAQVWSVYTNNFLVTLQQAGYKLNVIYPDDYGVHFYADSIFTSDDLIANNPDLVLRFLRATLKGWTYAVEHPSEIGPLVVQYAPAADAALETAKMTAALPLINTGEDQIGWMKPAVWDGMATTLHDQGVLTQPIEPTAAYTLEFVEAIYGQ